MLERIKSNYHHFTKHYFPIVKLYISYVAIIGLIFIVIFFVSIYLDKLTPSSFVVNIASLNENQTLPSVVNSFMVVFTKVATLFIPILVAITTLVINKYASSFIDILITDFRVVGLIAYYICFSVYRIAAQITYQQTYDTLLNFSILSSELILILLGLLLTLMGGLTLFVEVTLPKRKFAEKILQLNKKINKLYSKNNYNKNKVDYLEKEILNYITWYVNIFNSSVVSKDTKNMESILSSFENVCLLGVYKQDLIKERKVSLTKNKEFAKAEISDGQLQVSVAKGFNKDKQSKESYETYSNIMDALTKVFTQMFDISFSCKEFKICYEIIESAKKINDNNSYIFLSELYYNFFNTCLNHKNYEQTINICKKIIVEVNELYKKEARFNFDYYRRFLMLCINYNDKEVITNILEDYYDVLSVLNENQYKIFADKVRDVCLYSLRNKKYTFFVILIKFLVVKRLNISWLNEQFSVIKEEEEETELDKMLNRELDTKKELSKDNHKNKYNQIKFYVIWYSYYLLQLKNNGFRILNIYHNLKVGSSVEGSINFVFIKPLLIDLEAQETNWNKLFTFLAPDFFIDTINKLLDKSQLADLETEIKQMPKIKYFKLLKESIS